MKKIFIAFGLFLLLSFAIHLQAQIPRTLSYQGILTDNAGSPRPAGNYQFTFSLYDTSTGGTPIWNEQKTLSINKGGLFSTILGDQKSFGVAVKFDRQYWLGIQVENEAELSPRIRLTSVGYSMNAAKADTANVSLTSLANAEWMKLDSNVYRLNGNVGIGTTQPDEKLHLVGGNLKIENYSGKPTECIIGSGNLGSTNLVIGTSAYEGGHIYLQGISKEGSKWGNLALNPSDGNVGIGTPTPGEKLYVRGGNIQLENQNPRIFVADYVGTGYLGTDNKANFIIAPAMIQMVKIRYDGVMEVAGRTKTQVLEITGGSDIAEPFEISHTDSLPVGSLVVIDPEQPGKLKQATESYDKRVAGVISGAGGINPGLTLTQEGKLTGSQHVALTGKVYALATAANGAIEPGDLLTTSSIPGHAMGQLSVKRCQHLIVEKD